MDIEKKIGICVTIFLFCVVTGVLIFTRTEHDPIKIGILFAQTGNLAVTEKHLADATLLAIDEINKNGGLLNRLIKPIVVDPKSDNNLYKKLASELITQEHVAAIFGVWDSPTRRLVTEVVEQHNNFLFYPAHDEGLAESANVVYAGYMPNQAILPMVHWCVHTFGRKFFILGSKVNIFDASVIEIIRQQLAGLQGEVIGIRYIDNENQIPESLTTILAQKPDVIINMLDPYIAIPYFKQLRASCITADKVPNVLINISEIELQSLDAATMAGNYALFTYSQSINRKENRNFVQRMKQHYGNSLAISSVMESAYINVYFWKQAVQEAKTTATDAVRKCLNNQVFNAPGGVVYLDENNLHAWRTAYIGKIQSNGQFQIVWSTKKQIEPLIYPPYKDKEYWQDFIKKVRENQVAYGYKFTAWPLLA